jgi:hypothetical protein
MTDEGRKLIEVLIGGTWPAEVGARLSQLRRLLMTDEVIFFR